MLTGILFLGAALRMWGLTWGLRGATVSRRPHPDEWVVYWVFHWFDKYHNLNPCPRAPSQCFFDWGALYLILGYGARAIVDVLGNLVPLSTFGPGADPRFLRAVLAGRLVSAVLSIATILVVYLLGRDLRDRNAGLIAAGITALSGLLAQLAHFATPDSTTIFFLSLAILYLVRSRHATGRRDFLVGAACAGLATASEYHMALLAVPIAFVWLTGRRDRLSALLALLCFLAAWVLVNPYAVLHPGAFLDANLHSLRLRTVDSGEQYGDRWGQYGPAWLYVVRYPLGYGVGFALTGWLVLGVVWTTWRRRPADLVLVVWVLVYLLIVTLSPAKFMRYSAPLLPPLAALAGVTVMDLWNFRPGAVKSLVAVAALGTALYSFAYDAAYAQLFTAVDPRQLATQWIVRHASPNADISFEQIPDGLVNLPYFVAAAGYRPCFMQFDTDQLESPARYLVIDDYGLEQHPSADTASVLAFRSALTSDPAYRSVLHIEAEPSFAGLRFPIARSPHDWRYPAHSITIYRNLKAESRPDVQCYGSMKAALAALYVPPPGLSG